MIFTTSFFRNPYPDEKYSETSLPTQGDVSFTHPEHYIIIESYQNRSWIGPILWIQSVPNLFRISQYFEKLELEFLKFYCTQNLYV